MRLAHEAAVHDLHLRGNNSYLEVYAELASRCRDVPGDVVECGVYNGESLAAITSGLPGRRAWAYDSFQGFPPAGPFDDEGAHDLHGSSVVGDPERVRERVRDCSELVVREGWFKDTFKQPLPACVAFLSVDCDLYESVYLSLQTFAPLVASGGIITVDDWGCFIGCRRAVYDWVGNNGDVPLLRTFGPTQVWWQVP